MNRRKKNRSFRYTDNNSESWKLKTGDWSNYRGPMIPWVRLCSNSKGPESPKSGDCEKQGFVFYGGKGFYSDYGFSKNNSNNPSIIGYVPSAGINPHTIDNDLTKDYPIHVPAPEIERIHVTIQKELYRRASVEWTCFSKKQLEYMTPYFLIPGISCIMEWGWNLYNPESLVDLTDTEKLENLFNNPYPLYTQNIIKSRGNYDVIFGIITNFEWTVDGNKFRCKTEITSKDRIYAGLIVDSNSEDKSSVDENEEKSVKIFNSLTEFVDKYLDKFRGVWKTAPDLIPGLEDFTKYVRAAHPKKNGVKGNANEYLYGVFGGRDKEDKQNKFQKNPDKKDFDNKSDELWLNLGLIIEAINFHAGPLKGTKGKEMLRVDIDDVVVGAHPNMISSDGSTCLIPNFESPKYFYGKYGYDAVPTSFGNSSNDYYKLRLADSAVKAILPRSKAKKARGGLADYRLYTVGMQLDGKVSRDDIDQVINAIRYQKGIASGTCAFPFRNDTPSIHNKSNLYPAHYSGYLRHIYVSLSFLKGLLVSSSDVTTYYQFVEKILDGVNSACGGFWDLRLVSGLGDKTIPPDEPAPMKIVDYKFMSFSNRGLVWAFDYFDSDSLLLGIGFKPTLSNAQAIRTIYAPTNNPDNKTTVTNGNNELLDYKFKDRLHLGENVGNAPTPKPDRSGFEDTMRELQCIIPCDNSYPMTTGAHAFRLCLPATDIQQLLLDDGDEENNPKYTGIMPGIQATFTIQGIGGLRTFMMFLVRNLPEPYSEKNIIFRIVDVQETVESGKWTTQITAGVIPLREHIKARLGIT